MSEPTSMPGELEIMAVGKVLERSIHILNVEYHVIAKYGEGEFTTQSPLLLLFRSIGEDVGHYDCVIPIPPGTDVNCLPSIPEEPEEPSPVTTTVRHQNTSLSVSNHEIRDIIKIISPLPKLATKRPRTRKAETAAILTSSPYYRAELLRKQQVKPSTTTAKRNKSVKQKREKKKPKQVEIPDSVSDQEWPCLLCSEPFSASRPGDEWVQCQKCLNWAHDECTPGFPQFICTNCE